MPIMTYDFEDVVAYGADHSTISRRWRRPPRPKGETVHRIRSLNKSFRPVRPLSFRRPRRPGVSFDLGPAGPGAKANEEFLANHYHAPATT